MNDALSAKIFLIHFEAHCQKVENSNIFISQTVKDSLRIPTDLSSGGPKLSSVKKYLSSNNCTLLKKTEHSKITIYWFILIKIQTWTPILSALCGSGACGIL